MRRDFKSAVCRLQRALCQHHSSAFHMDGCGLSDDKLNVIQQCELFPLTGLMQEHVCLCKDAVMLKWLIVVCHVYEIPWHRIRLIKELVDSAPNGHKEIFSLVVELLGCIQSSVHRRGHKNNDNNSNNNKY